MFTIIFLLCVVYLAAGIMVDYVSADIHEPILRKDYWYNVVLWPKVYWFNKDE